MVRNSGGVFFFLVVSSGPMWGWERGLSGFFAGVFNTIATKRERERGSVAFRQWSHQEVITGVPRTGAFAASFAEQRKRIDRFRMDNGC